MARPSFDDAVSSWLTSFPSPNTRAAYRTDLTVFGRWCVEQGAVALTADAATLAAFHAAQEAAGHSPATRRRRASSLSSFFDYAVDAHLARTNPAAGVERPRAAHGAPSPTVRLAQTTVDDYLAVAAATDVRLDALVSLLVFDGLKLGEALALDVDDVRGRPPRVAVAVHRRSGGSRRVELADRSGRAVQRCAGGRAGEPLFVSRSSAGARRLTRFGADHLLKQLAPDAAEPPSVNALRRFHLGGGSRPDRTDQPDG